MTGKILRKPQAVIGLLMMLAVMIAVIYAPHLAPNDPNKVNIMIKFAEPSQQYPLGTDDMGRCIASRLIYGARISMSIALPTIAAIAVISVLLATVCAYIGGIVDKMFVIISNIFMALPPFLVAMTLVGIFESKALSIVVSIVIAMWVWNAQVVRTYVLREKSKPYIITCRMSGCSEIRIIMKHIIPNIFPHLLVLYSTGLSGVIIMISSYAFLGMGLETGTAEWGAMLVNANKLIFSHPELILYPGLCILFAAAGFNLFGEALRDICDPREG
ncbi:ABC transporter permease [uncultured Ruminococcus sp.]|uniref:ABC transporter permease n=1 Tax=uncultured Ruminococcus sp. TaxID=165186 RepID=UPI0025F6B1B8|nr:ABC transporter permease subunit [uncultured Ruminococcus sp.]